MPRRRLNPITIFGGDYDRGGWVIPSTGSHFYVDNTYGDDSAKGDHWDTAFKTLQVAIDACTTRVGDVITVMNRTETVTETVNFNKTGITVQVARLGGSRNAMGEYCCLLADTTFTDGPVATITAPCTIDGLGFASRDTGATFWSGAAALIGGLATASPYGVHMKNCRFPKWGLDNRIGLAIEGSSDCLIENCLFEGVGADFDSGIYVQGATQNVNIVGNWFRDCTYGVLFGAFAGSGPHCFIHGNHFEDSKCFSAASAATGILSDNWCEGATDTGSYNDTVDNLNALGLVFVDQHYAE